MKKLLAMMLTLTMLLTAVPAFSLAESAATDEKEATQLEGLMQLLGALALSTDSDAGTAEEETMSEGDLTALFSLFGALATQETETTKPAEETAKGEEQTGDAQALSALFGALLNTEKGQEAPKDDAAPAESESVFDFSSLFGALLGGQENKLTQPDIITAEAIDQFYGVWTLDHVEISGGISLSPDMLAQFDLTVAAQFTISENGVTMAFSANGEANEAPIECTVEFKDGALFVTADGYTQQCNLTSDGGMVCSNEFMNVYFVKGE